MPARHVVQAERRLSPASDILELEEHNYDSDDTIITIINKTASSKSNLT